ncbi:MAG: Ig-like domain-containing protein [Bacteroidales bacterium]|nr:Ig-like domain-containing protein [Bacteroidales bacterium]
MKTRRLSLMAVLSLALLGFFGCRPETVDVDSVTIRPASVELTVGSTYQLSAVVLPSDAPQELVWTSSRPAVANVNASGLVTTVAVGECDITVYASDKSDVCHVRVVDGNQENPIDPTTIAPNPTRGQWIDLGLPSGLKWYSVNLGATAPEHYGDYYAWGETHPRSVYTWETYSLGDYNSASQTYTMYKYNTSADYGMVDNKTTLEVADDAATSILGSGARIPTKAEWQELLDNTTATWTTQNGVYGRKYTVTNGNSLFLPVAGYRGSSELYVAGEFGDYWSSSLDEDSPGRAWGMYFSSHSHDVGSGNRLYGRSVRAVRSQN